MPDAVSCSEMTRRALAARASTQADMSDHGRERPYIIEVMIGPTRLAIAEVAVDLTSAQTSAAFKPREWLVEETGRVTAKNPHISYFRATGPAIGSLARLGVIERDPVLDLLERLCDGDWQEAQAEAAMFLRSHGRG